MIMNMESSATAGFVPKAVLFDFDGTLSVLTIDFAAMRRAAHASLRTILPDEALLNYPLDKPVMEALAGLTITLPAQKAAEARTLVEKRLIDFEIQAARRSRLFPFTLPVLCRLRDKGVATGIVTRNCRQSIETVFPNHRDYCPVLVTRHDVKRVKPHPDHLLAALKPMGVKPEDALMVGDHPTDIIAGRSAGCKSAAVLCGDGKLAELRAARPDYLIRDAEELMDVLKM